MTDFDEAMRQLTTAPGVTATEADYLRRNILAAFGSTEADMEQFERENPSDIAAEKELKRQRDEYVAKLPGRMRAAAAEVTSLGHTEGWLPPDTHFEVGEP